MANFAKAFISGTVGAGVLTLIHEAARRKVPRAPRMDIVGMRAVDRVMDWMHLQLLNRPQLRRVALAGDLVSNSLYYSAVPATTPGATWRRGLFLGALAGIGAVSLPERIGLGTAPDSRSRSNQLMTVAWYVFGGLAAAAAANAYADRTAAA
jgi:hypothetical protein